MTFPRAKHLVGLLRSEPGCTHCGAPVRSFHLNPHNKAITWFVMYECRSSWDSRGGDFDRTPECQRRSHAKE
jgi:hypothetical protein